MAYVKKTVAPGEEYIHRAKFNWTYDFVSYFWFTVGLIPAIFRALAAAGVVGDPSAHFGAPFTFFAVLSALVGLAICVTRSVHKWTTVIAITSTRLVFKRGLISRISAEVTLDKIEEITVRQTFLGRMLGFGRLTVRGTGRSQIEFPDLAKPIELRRLIEEAMVAAKNAKPAA